MWMNVDIALKSIAQSGLDCLSRTHLDTKGDCLLARASKSKQHLLDDWRNEGDS